MRFVQTLMRGLCVVAALVALPACGESHVPVGEYRIEWEPNDSALHGQVIRFLKPMAYILLEAQDIDEYLKEQVEVGRFLYDKQSAIEFSRAYRPYVIENLDHDSWFTIKATYWHRKDWVDRALAGDRRMMVLEDDHGIRSTTLFSILRSSDRADLVPARPWDAETEK